MFIGIGVLFDWFDLDFCVNICELVGGLERLVEFVKLEEF